MPSANNPAMGQEVDETLILPENMKHRIQLAAKLTDANNDAEDARSMKTLLRVEGNVQSAVEDRPDVPKDDDKPDGDAVNPDGTLKTADQIVWDHSPTSSPVLKRKINIDQPNEESISKKQKTHATSKPATMVDTATNDIGSGEASEMEEGEKRYWQIKSNGGETRTKCMRSAETADLCLCFRPDIRKVDGETKAGHYCLLCIENGVKESTAFMTGNVSARHKHITRAKNHYEGYIKLCDKHGIKGKAEAPDGWGQLDIKKQSSISDFTVVKAPPPPPFSKNALAEYITEFMVDCNLSISSQISVTYDGWSTKRRHPFSAFTIHYIHVDPENQSKWTLESQLLEFKRTHGRHTGKAVGKELLRVVDKYNWRDRMGWFVGDNITVNNVAIRYVCLTVDPTSLIYDPIERWGRCIEHAIHLMGGHFIIALQIPALMKMKRCIHQCQDDDEPSDLEHLHPDFATLEVDVSMDVQAGPQDAAAKVAAGATDFEPGDVVGKILAFVAQVHGGDTPSMRSHLDFAIL
ncbi:uncharacterized protein ARMOST_12523 [Armillaria ostoyae]|uniref:Uncharacterized protein n=1 Tax=Armillaria ostoyae TaxID=47428 RepID=A0A284RK96_ARMOS|nr:uncharacterized protein ARMOST_12523 [Armillaria ostoyae]